MTAPGDKTAAGSRSRDGLRASHAERDQVIDALKAAFVQGRLTKDELGARVGQVCASRTYAELAGVIADLPTALAGAPASRSPWRATKRAWWFEYAVFLPGILAIIFLPGGPHTTIWTFVILASVMYFVFWVLGVFGLVASRCVKPVHERELPPLCAFNREQATGTLNAALAQGRLAEDEHDERAAQVSTVQSRAELAALTADLPADLTARRPKARDGWTGVCVILAAVSVLAALLYWGPDNFAAFALALLAAATVLLAPPITVGLIIDARHQRRSGRHLRLGPPRSAGG